MRKMIQGSLIALLSFSASMAFANEADEVCTKIDESVETTVVIKKDNPAGMEMRIYRSFFGHTAPPQSLAVGELPGMKGSILAFGDEMQNRVLVINLAQKNDMGQPTGTFTDLTTGQSIPDMACD